MARTTDPHWRKPGERALKILLVEDDMPLAGALTTFLRGRGFAVEPASSLMDARIAVRAWPWDAVLLDLELPDGDGLSLLQEIRRSSSDASVIVLTSRDRISDRIRGLDSGADDYLVKPFDPEELLARLRAVERRRSRGNSDSVKLGELEVDLALARVRWRGDLVSLTASEWALLRAMAARPDRIHSRDTLMQALYGDDVDKDRNTLDVFMSHLRRKLGGSCIETVRGIGFRLTGHCS